MPPKVTMKKTFQPERANCSDGKPLPHSSFERSKIMPIFEGVAKYRELPAFICRTLPEGVERIIPDNTHNVLILNKRGLPNVEASFSKFKCNWKIALQLMCSGRAEAVDFYDNVWGQGIDYYYQVPSVIQLTMDTSYERGRDYAAYWKQGVYIRDQNKCQYCGTDLDHKNASIDHIVPASWGGEWTWENTVACCKSCNNLKKDRAPIQAWELLKDVNIAIPKKPSCRDSVAGAMEELFFTCDLELPHVPTVGELAGKLLFQWKRFPHESWKQHLLAGGKVYLKEVS